MQLSQQATELKQQLFSSLNTAAETVVQRFLETMPPRYFEQTDRATQLAHMTALVASEASGLAQELTLTSEDGNTWTFINEGNYPGQLGDLVRRLPRDRPLASARVHTSLDGRLVLDVFEMGRRARVAAGDVVLERYADSVGNGAGVVDDFSQHLLTCTSDYLSSTPPPVVRRHFQLVSRVRSSGNSEVDWQQRVEGQTAVDLCLEGGGTRLMFERVARYLGRRQLDIRRAHIATFEGQGSQRLLGFRVVGDWSDDVALDLRRLTYLDKSTINLWERLDGWSLQEAEVATLLLRLAHQKLVRLNSLAFTRARLEEALVRYAALARSLVSTFCERFRPGAEEACDAKLAAWVRKTIDREDDRKLFFTMEQAVRCSLRCNLFLETRQALAVRLHPGFLNEKEEGRPFGVFFVHGRDFDGFHVRFQDVARGGVRLVCPSGAEQHALESERLYDEALGLARAQQLKNKDIPEGGAKGVILTYPRSSAAQCARAFADGLLDLTTPDPAVQAHLVDRYGAQELLYLGPDENVSNELIEWIVERARLRGYPLPAAFMSSKPGAGINHKAYGITSEGVTVFLDVALRQLGIDPHTQPFTVKLTGGPDGDVAGNEIKILLRDYPTTARIIGVADGSGCAEDPEGLNPAELLRLVEASLPIAAFDRAKLGKSGALFTLEDPEGLRQRNTLHNRLVCDAFVPAGGRPRTLNSDNWREFLDGEGRPSSGLIVEGANLFLTDTARRRLGEAGVVIVKDSSANKCGVICSSFEILASMLCDENEFLQMKETFVAQVIERLRLLARREAELLFRERRQRPELLIPDLSVRLSRAILEATEAVAEAQARLTDEDRSVVDHLLLEYLPEVLRPFAAERMQQVPLSYRQRIVACSLAGRIVYREGLSFLESMSHAAIAELSLAYLRQENEVARLVSQVRDSDLPDRERIAHLLSEGGTRAGLKL